MLGNWLYTVNITGNYSDSFITERKDNKDKKKLMDDVFSEDKVLKTVLDEAESSVKELFEEMECFQPVVL